MNNTCPNGYICINHFQTIIIIVIVLGIMYAINNESYKKLFTNSHQLEMKENEIRFKNNEISQLKEKELSQLKEQNNYRQHNENVISDPLYPPLKRGIPINIETRESGGDYQQLGILSKGAINDDTETPGNNTDSVIVPLYGKPTYRGSNKWLYYTETDKLKPVKIPVNFGGKDCTDDYGCDEIYDGTSVTIPSYNGDFTAKIYKMNKPRYIPFV
jgi:hypothetical protein